MTKIKNKIFVGHFFLYLVLFLIISGCVLLEKKEYLPIYIEQFSGNYDIPDNYKSYTLFFSTSYQTKEFLTVSSKDELKGYFKKFGESIGEGNVAVWVRNPDSDDLNIELGKTYADRIHKWYNLSLEYSDGPYLVFMTRSPNVPPMRDDFAVAIGFKDKTSTDITKAIEYSLKQKSGEKKSPNLIFIQSFIGWISSLLYQTIKTL